MTKSCILCLLLFIFARQSHADKTEVEQAKLWLSELSRNASEKLYPVMVLAFTYQTNLTKHNNKLMSEGWAEYVDWLANKKAEASRLFDVHKLTDDPLTHRTVSLSMSIPSKLTKNQTMESVSLSSKLMWAYNTGTICAWSPITRAKNCSEQWSLDPHLYERMARSTDYDELTYIWSEWRNITKAIKPTYKEKIELLNVGVKQGNGGLKDVGELWRSRYELPDDVFTAQLEKILHQLLPFYEQLHTYVRRKLKQRYEGNFETSAIPAHLLGNMWAQKWGNLFEFTKPFPSKKSGLDVTDEMLKQGYTPKRMFQLADEFFTSLGLPPMPPKFWKNSMIVKPADTKANCHASAWNMYGQNDFRVKMCTDVNMVELVTVHHEMGHVQYFLNYKDQPIYFQGGANPGFHEAVGDTIALSVNTPKHLHEVGLLHNYEHDEEQDLNYLFKQALDRVAFIPFGYLIDMWRWRVTDGSYSYEEWNDKWWMWRHKLQGIVPPIERPHDAFDPGAKYHVPAGTPYIRYFIRSILQFQFYKAMCQAAGHKGPLHQCDFYRSKAAGDRMKAMLKLGSSVEPPLALKAITGQEDMSVDAFVEYFQPIYEWLKKTNEAAGDCYGWNVEWPAEVMETLPQPRCGTLMYTFMQVAEPESPPESEPEAQPESGSVKDEADGPPKASNASSSPFIIAIVILGLICAVLLIVSTVLFKKSHRGKVGFGG